MALQGGWTLSRSKVECEEEVGVERGKPNSAAGAGSWRTWDDMLNSAHLVQLISETLGGKSTGDRVVTHKRL